MPGRRSRSGPLALLGILAAVVGVVGFVVFGWRFGEATGPLPLALGVLFAAVAVVVTLLNR